jgi:hypothetical protein
MCYLRQLLIAASVAVEINTWLLDRGLKLCPVNGCLGQTKPVCIPSVVVEVA